MLAYAFYIYIYICIWSKCASCFGLTIVGAIHLHPKFSAEKTLLMASPKACLAASLVGPSVHMFPGFALRTACSFLVFDFGCLHVMFVQSSYILRKYHEPSCFWSNGLNCGLCCLGSFLKVSRLCFGLTKQIDTLMFYYQRCASQHF